MGQLLFRPNLNNVKFRCLPVKENVVTKKIKNEILNLFYLKLVQNEIK